MSRELDAWLAERLFGWTEVDPPRQGDGPGYRGAGVAPGASGASEVPGYSTDGNAMLAVIAAMESRGHEFGCGFTGGEFHAEFWGPLVGCSRDNTALAARLPLAVAEAARRALESEGEAKEEVS